MKRKRILVVDDEVSFTRLLKLNLEQTDEYEVRAESRAEEAVATARAFRPDLILLDIMMPRMTGGDVAARLQADVRLRATPIVFLSAAVKGESAGEYEEIEGGTVFISKPASVEEVLSGIEHRLARGQSTGSGFPDGYGVPPGLGDRPVRVGETVQLAL